MILQIIGYIIALIGVIIIDYTICNFFNIVYAFWIQILGAILYIIGLIIEKK